MELDLVHSGLQLLQGQGLHLGRSCKGNMVRVQAGIQNGYHHAAAVISHGIDHIGANAPGTACHHRLQARFHWLGGLIAGSHIRGLHAWHGLQRFQITIAHLHGEAVKNGSVLIGGTFFMTGRLGRSPGQAADFLL